MLNKYILSTILPQVSYKYPKVMNGLQKQHQSTLARDASQCANWKVQMMSDAIQQGLVDEDTPLAFFWNLTDFQKQLKEAQDAFSNNFLHTVATKANPLVHIMEIAKEAGAGAEAASIGELELAMKAKHDPKNIVLDSPAKTRKELQLALKYGVGLTLDNLDELKRVDEILKEHPEYMKNLGNIGIRINPQIGAGAIVTHSVSKLWSKFGTPITELYNEVIQAYLDRPWLNMLHVHVGSQTYTPTQLAHAIQNVVELAIEINSKTSGLPKQGPHHLAPKATKQITVLDIGGGLPVNFSDEISNISFQEYADILREVSPALFTGEFAVLTEFGRRFLAKQGVAVSRIEYVKEAGGRRIVLQHVGADVAVRTVYRPEAWPLRVSCFNSKGHEMQYADEPLTPTKVTKPLLPADIAGPCCIDDVLAPSQRPLPDVQEGDFVMFHDTGAYYHSAYSYYNCRQAPALYSFHETTTDQPLTFTKIRPYASVDETIEFFTTKSNC